MKFVDGTSNMIFIREDAGRPKFYDASRQIFDPVGKEGGWADPNGAFSVDGANSEGGVSGGCSVNCSNNRELYSWHQGGAIVVFAAGQTIDLSLQD